MKDIMGIIKTDIRKANYSEYFDTETEKIAYYLEDKADIGDFDSVFIHRTRDCNEDICAITIVFNGKKDGLIAMNLEWRGQAQFVELHNLQWED